MIDAQNRKVPARRDAPTFLNRQSCESGVYYFCVQVNKINRLKMEVTMAKQIITKTIIGLAVLFIGYFAGVIASDCSSADHAIEYRIMAFNHFSEGGELEDELNRMGAQGWELIQVKEYMAIFKR